MKFERGKLNGSKTSCSKHSQHIMINEIIHDNNEQGCMLHSHTVQTVSNELSQCINVAKCESMPALTLHLCDTLRWPRSQAALTPCEHVIPVSGRHWQQRYPVIPK